MAEDGALSSEAAANVSLEDFQEQDAELCTPMFSINIPEVSYQAPFCAC